MRFTLKHGTTLETATPDEVRTIIAEAHKRSAPKRVRANAIVLLDASGNGQAEVYTIPVGFQFEARRVFLDLDTASDPSTGNVALNVAGKAVDYLRSGTRIEYAVPFGPNAASQIPGVQTWGSEQGPYFRNGEVFEVRARGLTANARLSVTVEGILSPGELRS